MLWILSGTSLLATYLNIHKRRVCFALWAVTNSAWVVADLAHGLYARAPLDAIYTGLAVWGWFKWR